MLRWLVGLLISYAILWGPQMLVSPVSLPTSLAQAGDALSRLARGGSVSPLDWLSIIRVASVFVLLAIVANGGRRPREAPRE